MDELYQPLGMAGIALWGMVTLIYLRRRRTRKAVQQRINKRRPS